MFRVSLVNIEDLCLVVRLAKLLVLAHKEDLGDPCKDKCRDGESCRRAQGDNIAGLV